MGHIGSGCISLHQVLPTREKIARNRSSNIQRIPVFSSACPRTRIFNDIDAEVINKLRAMNEGLREYHTPKNRNQAKRTVNNGVAGLLCPISGQVFFRIEKNFQDRFAV